MTSITKINVTNAIQVDKSNWIATRDPFGPLLIPDGVTRGECAITLTTEPNNNASEWMQIAWSSGGVVLSFPNQRTVSRNEAKKMTLTARFGSSVETINIWVLWATVRVQTQGPRPARAVSWTVGAPFTGGEVCGAVVVPAFSMGENARGQIVAKATLEPPGVGKLISDAGKNSLLKFRRQVTAHDFADGKRAAGPKNFSPWAGDDSIDQMMTIDPGPDDALYDTDSPELPTALRTSETYNNFRQWVTFDGAPCSSYGTWFFRARWKNRKVILKEIGEGATQLPQTAQLK
jgi:hypothetical protein